MVLIEVSEQVKNQIEKFKEFIEKKECKEFSMDETISIGLALAFAAFKFAKNVNIPIEK